MATWTPILCWALLCSLAQGCILYFALRLTLTLLPGISPAAKYRLSLAAQILLLLGFVLNLAQQAQLPGGTTEVAAGLSAVPPALQPGRFLQAAASLPMLPRLAALFPYLALAYLAGLAFMLLRLMAGIGQLSRLRHKGVSVPDLALYASLQTLKTRLQLQRRVRLLVTERARVPMVLGFLKPVILLPAASVLQLSTEQLEAILLHELAHIRRQDFLLNMLQTVAETLLFFNPFVWLISAIVRREREYSCDDLVLAHTGGRLSYAQALGTLAGLDCGPLALAAAGKPGQLMQRIRRIVEGEKRPFSYSRTTAVLLSLALILLTVSHFSGSFAMVRSELIGTPLESGSSTANSEELGLIACLSKDHLIDEAKGFVIEKRGGQLLIDYKALPDALARKYLSPLTKKELYIQVYPLQERIRRHPGSSLLQLAAPVQLSSPCVDYSAPPKEGC